ncbi:helix-turn-helix transcriptional regulator [Pararhizobium sp.]|uniref:helix-turn-helix transcriptional regulator n=1 Tax=Pararhizobium sp. TaxID=1977563 RepID=UPI002718CEFB|nr:LuxR family transcriptional regulator [Pararhizobium sp.]MDO9415660.1 LuxR family transcriptional regulator [Pararhizobium sp.]
MIDFFQSNSSSIMPGHDENDCELATEDDVARLLERLTVAYGFNGFLVITLPSQPTETLKENLLLTNWPKEMQDAYDAASLFGASPIIEKLRKAAVPFSYEIKSANRRRGDGKSEIAINLFERFGMTTGAYFPAQLADGQRGAISVSGTRGVLRQEEMLQLNMFANYIFNRVGQLRKPERVSGSSLSERELECIYWAAAGKTSSEMAGILDLSEHTVNHYLNRAGRKLDAVNRVQAVAKAYRAGLIH